VKTSAGEISRIASLQALNDVLIDRQSLDQSIATRFSELSEQQLSFAKALVYGCLRMRSVLEDQRDRYLKKPLHDNDRDIGLILILGIYQLGWMSTAAHAAIKESVDLAHCIQKKWAAGLINAVLRRYQREGTQTEPDPNLPSWRRFAHPKWLHRRLKAAWPEQFMTMLEANQQQAPMWLRVNQCVLSRTDFCVALDRAEIPYQPHPYNEVGVQLINARPFNTIPGFDQAWFTVQDGAAQLAAGLLQARPGDRVLDACAAPGGKSTHLLEYCPQIDLSALELSPQRASRIQENLQRLKLDAKIIIGDASNPGSWWDGQPYDRILLDVPCSATGVIRRHPDIKWLRRNADIQKLSERQMQILKACWALLKPGGTMLYATCSVLPDENQQILEHFEATKNDLIIPKMNALWGQAQSIGRQILPGEQGMDGFYYAVLQKK